MKHCNYFTDLSTLRKAYLEVHNFLKQETGETDIKLKSKLTEDFGCYGDDNWDLLNKFASKYNLKADGFEYSKYFESESELFHNGMFMVYLLLFPFCLVVWIVKAFVNGFKNLNKISFYPNWNRNPEPKDLTFADLLVWYLKGNFCLRENVAVALQ